jgi:hypothetical protein
MQRFTFRLDPLIKLKRQTQRLAELQLLDKQSCFGRARQYVDGLRQRLSASTDVIQRQVTAQGQQDRCLTECLLASQICDRLQQAHQEMLEAECQLRDSAAKHRDISVELEALESLRWRKWRDYVKSRQRDNQENLDAFVMRQWQQSNTD